MTKTIQLSKRLRAIADLVTPEHRLADIGTDHGYLPIWLLQNQRIPYALGLDIRPGPLEHAGINMQNAGVSDKMELRLSDGLEQLQASEADTVVISGMGGMLIISILQNARQKVRCMKELILSPQSDIPMVRQFLRTNGFLIVDEQVVIDGQKFYTIIKAVPTQDGSGTSFRGNEQTLEDQFGPVLLEKRPEAFIQMLMFQRKTNQQIIDQLESALKTDTNRDRLNVLKQKQEDIKAILENAPQAKGV
ncbi:MAG: SAM-dependent methyltransferase [Eubacterium sp.]|nr:SAM-dependent methyltransferase [Eubacterium sp.]MBQ9022443.1 SAM-dependent methyltransferase [Eubacterium sp.]